MTDEIRHCNYCNKQWQSCEFGIDCPTCHKIGAIGLLGNEFDKEGQPTEVLPSKYTCEKCSQPSQRISLDKGWCVKCQQGDWEKKYIQLKKHYEDSMNETQRYLDELNHLKDRIIEYFVEGE